MKIGHESFRRIFRIHDEENVVILVVANVIIVILR